MINDRRVSGGRKAASGPWDSVRFLVRVSLVLAALMITLGYGMADASCSKDGGMYTLEGCTCETRKPESDKPSMASEASIIAAGKEQAYYDKYHREFKDKFKYLCGGGGADCKLSLKSFEWICGETSSDEQRIYEAETKEVGGKKKIVFTPDPMTVTAEKGVKDVSNGQRCTSGKDPVDKPTKAVEKSINDGASGEDGYYERIMTEHPKKEVELSKLCKSKICTLNKTTFEWVCQPIRKNSPTKANKTTGTGSNADQTVFISLFAIGSVIMLLAMNLD